MGPPSKQGPPTGLLITLGVLLTGLVVAIVFVMTDDDDDPSTTADRTSTTESDNDSTTTESDDEDTTTTEADDSTSTTVGPDDPMVTLMATALVEQSGDVLTEEEGSCLAQAMINGIGLDRLMEAGLDSEGGGDPTAGFTPDELSVLASAMVECVPSDKLDELGDAFGGIEPGD